MLAPPREKEVIQVSGSEISVTVLNQTITFQKKINWAEERHGKLWNYQLQYADFLKQNSLPLSTKENLISDLYKWLESGKLSPEPYPASLRVMNVVRFLATNNELERKDELLDFLYSELHFLEKRLEYHLLGNHLLENGFALLMGGAFMNNQRWTKTARHIFSEEVPEQILSDGGHFERSPMYHLILLYRFLEALYYLPSDDDLHPLFLETSKKMLGWIDQMSFQNGDLAHFNDSTDGQSCSKNEIFQIARECGITDYPTTTLGESGFRRFEAGGVELLVDVSGIEPIYQPAHAHADSLSFILYYQGKPIITDPGVSTYETGERRNWERSTKAHNTVTFRDQNTAGMWDKFRVASRPGVEILKESDFGLDISLKYTLKSGELFKQTRNIEFTTGFVEITDFVNLEQAVDGRLHFHPNIRIQELTKNKVILNCGITIKFLDVHQIQQFTYKCSTGFNRRSDSIGICYTFKKNTSLRIILQST